MKKKPIPAKLLAKAVQVGTNATRKYARDAGLLPYSGDYPLKMKPLLLREVKLEYMVGLEAAFRFLRKHVR